MKYIVEYRTYFTVDMFSVDYEIRTEEYKSPEKAIERAKKINSQNTSKNWPHYNIQVYSKELIEWEK